MIPAYAFTELSKGSKGEAVTKVQKRLNELGYSVGTIDGDFGEKTNTAVKRFQKEKHLKPTGIVNEETYYALFPSEKPTEKPTLKPEPTPIPKATPKSDYCFIDDLLFIGMYHYQFIDALKNNGISYKYVIDDYSVYYSKEDGKCYKTKNAQKVLCNNFMFYGHDCDAYFYFSKDKTNKPLFSSVFVIDCNSINSAVSLRSEIISRYGDSISRVSDSIATQIDLLISLYVKNNKQADLAVFKVIINTTESLYITCYLCCESASTGNIHDMLEDTGKLFIEFRLHSNDELTASEADKLRKMEKSTDELYEIAISAIRARLKNPQSLQVNGIEELPDKVKEFNQTNAEALIAVDCSAMNSFGGYSRKTYFCIINKITGEVRLIF